MPITPPVVRVICDSFLSFLRVRLPQADKLESASVILLYREVSNTKFDLFCSLIDEATAIAQTVDPLWRQDERRHVRSG